jgi:hypothetical protein
MTIKKVKVGEDLLSCSISTDIKKIHEKETNTNKIARENI